MNTKDAEIKELNSNMETKDFKIKNMENSINVIERKYLLWKLLSNHLYQGRS